MHTLGKGQKEPIVPYGYAMLCYARKKIRDIHQPRFLRSTDNGLNNENDSSLKESANIPFSKNLGQNLIKH